MKRNSLSGGVFLMAAILIGFGWGAVRGNALEATLFGTAVGIVILVFVWLVDRRRD